MRNLCIAFNIESYTIAKRGVQKVSPQNLFRDQKPVVKLCFHEGPWDGAELTASQQAALLLCQAELVYASLDALPMGLEHEVVWTATTGLVTISKTPGDNQATYKLVALEDRILHFAWKP